MTTALTIQFASCFRFSWLLLTQFISRPLLLLALSAGLMLGALPFVSMTATASTPEAKVSSGLADGIYAFGESQEPGEPGVTYMVMTVQSQQVTGAFYQPSSSFDCFYGHIAGNEMVLTVVDSYDQTQNPYVLALTASSPIAAQGDSLDALVPEGFYALAGLSSLDQSLVETCQGTQSL